MMTMDKQSLTTTLLRQLESKVATTFFINGPPGAGKSYLLHELAESLPAFEDEGVWGRLIAGEAWGRTVTLLEYKTKDRGGKVGKVPARGTSQTCHQCGHVDRANRNGEAFCCRKCGHADNADINAARNILSRFVGGVQGPARKGLAPAVS